MEEVQPVQCDCGYVYEADDIDITLHDWNPMAICHCPICDKHILFKIHGMLSADKNGSGIARLTREEE